MKYLYGFSFGLIVLLGSSCIKGLIHVDPFPIKANPGKFECYINGEDYVPDSNRLNLFGGPILAYVNDFGDPYGTVIDTSTPSYASHNGQGIDLSVQHVTGTGVYEFDTPEHQEADYFLYPVNYLQPGTSNPNPPEQVLSYRLYTPGHGSLTVTRFDLKNKVIAGTFWFTAVNTQNPLDSVKVTGGHFNISYANQ